MDRSWGFTLESILFWKLWNSVTKLRLKLVRSECNSMFLTMISWSKFITRCISWDVAFSIFWFWLMISLKSFRILYLSLSTFLSYSYSIANFLELSSSLSRISFKPRTFPSSLRCGVKFDWLLLLGRSFFFDSSRLKLLFSSLRCLILI